MVILYVYSLPVGGPRFERPLNQSNPKQALSQMLRMRLPSNQYLGTQQPPPGFPQSIQRQQFIRYSVSERKKVVSSVSKRDEMTSAVYKGVYTQLPNSYHHHRHHHYYHDSLKSQIGLLYFPFAYKWWNNCDLTHVNWMWIKLLLKIYVIHSNFYDVFTHSWNKKFAVLS